MFHFWCICKFETNGPFPPTCLFYFSVQIKLFVKGLFSIVETGKITVPLGTSQGSVTNELYIKDFTASLLKSAFPHLQDVQIKLFVKGLFSLNQDIPAFKEHLRDFLVQIKEVAGDDTSDLFLEEREAQLRLATEEKRKIQLSVPGIINPHDMPEEMQD